MRTALLALALVGCTQDDGQVPTVATDTDAVSVCEEHGWTARERITEGAFGHLRRQLADDFTVPTTDGDWVWSEHFTGCESVVFVPDTLVVSPLDASPLLSSRGDLKSLLLDGPQNVHYFFVTASLTKGGESAFVDDMAKRVDKVLDSMKDDDAAWWFSRVHVVTDRLEKLDGWVADAVEAGAPGFTIDRFQRIREIGGLADVNRYDGSLDAAGAWPWQANLAAVRHEVAYYNHESDRQDFLDATDWTTVHLFHEENIAANGRSVVEAELPDASTMATFDTLLVDLTHACDNTQMEFGNCDAWDAIETLWLCDDPADPDVCGTELARYITTYHREGRWLADASQMLPLLHAGGTFRFQLGGTRGGHFNTLRLHLGITRDDGLKPFKTVPMWSGGSWTETYDEEHGPLDIDVPADARQTVLHLLLSGHGGESDDNCAEFCDHRHTFSVGGSAYTAEHPQMGDQEGCLNQIDQGTVPNQHGTWWFERSSWCPGKQVDPWVWDISGDVRAGQKATISYDTNWGEGVDGGSVRLWSWVTYWR